MKITLLTVGKIKEKYFTMAIDEYKKRLSRYCKLEIIEVADEKTPDNASEHEEDIIRAKEGERLTKYIKDGAYVICHTGKTIFIRGICGQDRQAWDKRGKSYYFYNRRLNRDR